MENLNKRSFLKFFGIGLGSFFASKSFGKVLSTANKAQLIYRIDFPTELSKHEFKALSKNFFNKSLHKELLTEIGCKNSLQKHFVTGPLFLQKTLTFPTEQSLNLYVQKIKERKAIINHNAMIDAGYKVSFKVLT